jgi:hypothetical protein
MGRLSGATAPEGRNKNTRHCETSPQTGRGNPPDFPAFSLEIVTFYHSTTGLPRRFAPRNDVVIFTFKQPFITPLLTKVGWYDILTVLEQLIQLGG